jgi:hypothetical protein
MRKPTRRAVSYLFTVRVWHEDLGNGVREWRGEVRDVASSEQHYFRDWHALVDFIQTSCHAVEQDGVNHDVGAERHSLSAP